MLDAIDYYNSLGGVVVFAAGNGNSDECYYPGCYEGVVNVAAVDNSNVRASFSNYGETIDIAAPGVDVFSTITEDGYGHASGTSMACPHVAGVLALGASANPQATKPELLDCLYVRRAGLPLMNRGDAAACDVDIPRRRRRRGWDLRPDRGRDPPSEYPRGVRPRNIHAASRGGAATKLKPAAPPAHAAGTRLPSTFPPRTPTSSTSWATA